MHSRGNRAADTARPAAHELTLRDIDVLCGRLPRRQHVHTVSVTKMIDADRWDSFRLLADLGQHWRFAGQFVDVLNLDGPPGARTGAVLRLHGPLGLRRTLTTRLVRARAPCTLEGTAATGSGTRASIAWTMSAATPGTIVELSVTIVPTGTLDRALLRRAGRAWLRRQLTATLERFSTEAAHKPLYTTAA